jgi:hypothetical protein
MALPLDLEALLDLGENASAQSGFPLPKTDDETIALTRKLLELFVGDDSLD